ncbi:uncharacterized protein RAG0_05511 [Rhynchosporium agropyri]|uniref:Uncharacterized protein n=1 Tax=Rhynchosporium agropyri TaxID=914238 RepID=A0A1E1KDJ1_9HELO|nr:uncharacterized protein RAG0_05511 [Rhynchosporium agropyri]
MLSDRKRDSKQHNSVHGFLDKWLGGTFQADQDKKIKRWARKKKKAKKDGLPIRFWRGEPSVTRQQDVNSPDMPVFPVMNDHSVSSSDSGIFPNHDQMPQPFPQSRIGRPAVVCTEPQLSNLPMLPPSPAKSTPPVRDSQRSQPAFSRGDSAASYHPQKDPRASQISYHSYVHSSGMRHHQKQSTPANRHSHMSQQRQPTMDYLTDSQRHSRSSPDSDSGISVATSMAQVGDMRRGGNEESLAIEKSEE